MASQSDKVTLLILAVVPRSLWPALIPNVGVGLREHAHTLHRQASQKRSSRAHNAECIATVQSTKISEPLGFRAYVQAGGKTF